MILCFFQQKIIRFDTKSDTFAVNVWNEIKYALGTIEMKKIKQLWFDKVWMKKKNSSDIILWINENYA